MRCFFQKMILQYVIKGKAVGDDEYNNSKIPYMLLKRDLSDINDLYNA